MLSRCRELLLKLKYIKSDRFAYGSRLVGDIVLEGRNFLDKNAVLMDSSLGFASYIGHDTKLIKTKVERFSCIGPDVAIIIGNHPSSKFVSIHPAFFSLQKQSGFTYVDQQIFDEYVYADDDRRYFVKIGNDVWIGSSVRIMSGVTIGDGAIIGAGALVVKDVEPFSIIGGVPAKIIRYRFDHEDIEMLKEYKWWDKDIGWIKKNAYLFSDINKMRTMIQKG